jgi:hypothetical protein
VYLQDTALPIGMVARVSYATLGQYSRAVWHRRNGMAAQCLDEDWKAT